MSDRSTTNILITAIGCNTAISIAKGLRLDDSRRYKIIGTDMAPRFEAAGSIFCDGFFQVPSFKDAMFIGRLLEIAVKENIQVIMSVVDQEVAVLAAHAGLFAEKGIQLCVSDLRTVDICNDKFQTSRYLAERGINIVPTYLRSDMVGKSDLQFPLFIKPRFGVSSADCHKVVDREELEFFLCKVEEPIIQEFMEGDQYVIDVLNDLNGKNIVAIPRHEISAKAGIGVKAVTVPDKTLCDYGIKLSELLGIKGVANIEVFMKRGEISLIEVNPRFSAGSILSVVAGVNLPVLAVDLFLGREITPSRLVWREGVYMSRYWRETFSLNGEMLDELNFHDYKNSR